MLGAAGEADEPSRVTRLLGDASLLVQQYAGISAEPIVSTGGREGIVEAASSAGLLVIGLSDRWSEGLRPTRSEIAKAAPRRRCSSGAGCDLRAGASRERDAVHVVVARHGAAGDHLLSRVIPGGPSGGSPEPGTGSRRRSPRGPACERDPAHAGPAVELHPAHASRTRPRPPDRTGGRSRSRRPRPAPRRSRCCAPPPRAPSPRRVLGGVRQRLLHDAVDRALGLGGEPPRSPSSTTVDTSARPRRLRSASVSIAGPRPSSSSAAGRSSAISARRFSISRFVLVDRVAQLFGGPTGAPTTAASAGPPDPGASVVQLARPPPPCLLGRFDAVAQALLRHRLRGGQRWSPRWRRRRRSAPRPRRRTRGRRRGRAPPAR